MWQQRRAALGYLSILILPLALVAGAMIGKPFLAAGVALLVFPLGRAIFGTYRKPPVWREALATALHLLPMVYGMTLLASLATLLKLMNSGAVAGIAAWCGLAISLALTLLFATCPVHELLHRRETLELRIGAWLAGIAGYPLLCVEHRDHHVNPLAAKAVDEPRCDESVWGFSWRRITGVTGAALELCRAAPEYGQGAIALRNLRQACCMTVLTGALFTAFGGPAGLAAYAFSAVLVTFGVQLMTYIQHWGLPSNAVPAQQIAWEDDCMLQAWLTLHVSFHQSHHRKPNLPFYRLALTPDAPRLPAGYIVLLFASLVPKVWRAAMQPALTHWQQQPLKPRSPSRRFSCFNAYGSPASKE